MYVCMLVMVAVSSYFRIVLPQFGLNSTVISGFQASLTSSGRVGTQGAVF